MRLGAAQQYKIEQSSTDESLRGLSSVSQKIAWASGTHGTFLRTLDGGRTWQVGRVPGAEALDFRDVEAFSVTTAYLGTSPVIRLHAAGLKVGQLCAQAWRATGDFRAARRLALLNTVVQDFSDAQWRAAGLEGGL